MFSHICFLKPLKVSQNDSFTPCANSNKGSHCQINSSYLRGVLAAIPTLISDGKTPKPSYWNPRMPNPPSLASYQTRGTGLHVRVAEVHTTPVFHNCRGSLLRKMLSHFHFIKSCIYILPRYNGKENPLQFNIRFGIKVACWWNYISFHLPKKTRNHTKEKYWIL